MSGDNGTKGGELVRLPDRTEDGPAGPNMVPQNGLALGTPPAARPVTPNFDMMRFVRSSLRGRYALVIILGLIMGGLGAAAGWKLGRPQYASEGLVRIAYSLPSPDSADPTSPLPNFDMFMQSQKLLITSRRVIDMAMQDPVWKTTGRQLPEAPDQYYAEHMTVDVRPRSEYMRVVVTDDDPNRAATAVTAIINAYAELYDTQEKVLHRKRIATLTEQREGHKAQVAALTAQIREKCKEYGTSDLEPFFVTARVHLDRMEAALTDLRVAIATRPTVGAAPGAPVAQQVGQQVAQGPATRPADPPQLTPERIAMTDPIMGNLLESQFRWEDEVRRMVTRGAGDNHRSLIQAREELGIAKARVESYAEAHRQFHAATARNLSDPRQTPLVTAGKSIEELRDNEASLVKLLEAQRAAMVAIGNKRQELQRLTTELANVTQLEQQASRKIDSLGQIEAMGGRLTIISTGEPPLSPINDPRIKKAAMGAIAGSGLPFGLVLLLSFARRTYRYSDEAEDDALLGQVPFLGIVPELEDREDDHDLKTAAAQCVHQLRVSLLSRYAGGGPRVYLITSATAGEGKTTLTMSLALSCRAAQFRTLVIDCDLVGRQLTEGLEAANSDGLREALASGTIRKRVHLSPSGVYTLTAGRATSADACGLGADSLRTLLSEARQYFHVILIDTGPILGSVEAAIAAQEADGVILAVTRGQRPRVVEQAIRRLAGLNARISGVVFNRAKASDFRRSPYGSSSYAAGIDADPTSARGAPCAPASLDRFGGLVHAVAEGMPESKN